MASENGWEPAKASPDQCEWITVPGTNPPVSLQLLKGWPLAIMRAVAADFNAFIQPLRDGDSAARTETNSVPTSNHLNATAMDLDWEDHPFHVRGTFNADQMVVIRELLDFYEGTIFWAGDWQDPIDEMHWQMGYDTFNNPHTGDFIARKIRADGYSTFRRGGSPVPPPAPPAPSRADRYAQLIIAEGQRRGITARGVQIALATGLVESNLKVYANERVPESMRLPHDDVGSDAYSVGIFQQQVRDSGNGWWWGDAATCMDPTSSAGLFYDRLARLDYNGSNSPGSYAQAVQSSAFPDRYDERFNDAVAIYNRLATNVPPPQGEDDLSAEAERQISVIYRELTQKLPSRSPLRHLGEGVVDTMAGFVLNTDGSVHVEIVRLLAGYGHPPTLALLREVAGADPNLYPDRQDDAKMAQAILADVTSKPAPQVVTVAAAPVAAPVADPGSLLDIAYAENARLREENSRLQAAVNTPAPVVSAPVPAVIYKDAPPAMTSGDHAGKVIDSVEDWTQHILAMDTPQRAAFATSMKALDLPNGSQP